MPDTAIQDKVILPDGGPTLTITGDATKEAIPASNFNPRTVTNWAEALKLATDIYLRDFGEDLYIEQMMLDPQVSSLVQILVMAILCEGVTVTPSRKYTEEGKMNPDDPDFKQAQKMARFGQDLLDSTDQPFMERIHELAEGAITMGNKLGELVWELRDYEGQQFLMLKDVKPRPFKNVRYVVDAYYTELGIQYVQAGTGAWTGTFPVAASSIKNLVPRSKFVAFKRGSRNGDPRGTALLKSIYTNYWKKSSLHGEHMAFLARFAQAWVYAVLGENAPATRTVNGTEVTETSIVNTALEGMRAGGVMTLPNGYTAEFLEARQDGKVFLETFDHEDRQMAKGVLFQTLTTEQSGSMARAASQVHQDVFGIVIRDYRQSFEWRIKHEIIARAIEYNYGPAYLKYVPEVSLGMGNQQDFARNASAMAQLFGANAIHPSQYPGIFQMLGLPQPNMEEVMQEHQQKQSLVTSLQAANPGGRPVGPTGNSGGNTNIQKDNSPNFDSPEKAGQNG